MATKTFCESCAGTKWLWLGDEQVKCARCGLVRVRTISDYLEFEEALNLAYCQHSAKVN